MRLRISFEGQHYDMVTWEKVGDLYKPGGFMDPIMAVATLENARENEGSFIWAKDRDGVIHALYAGLITEGWVVT